MTTININLELGDIIKLHAPTNEEINEKPFIISFINENVIDLNSSDKELTLTLEDEKLTDESITKISILYKNPLKGFIKQNEFRVGNWLDIQFHGDVPTIVTAQITEIIEDMIELKLYPGLNVIYIDFSYNGIPKELKIERIVERDAPEEFVEVPIVVSELPTDEVEEEVDETTFDYEFDIAKIPEVKIQDDIIEGSKIVFGETMGELVQIVEVDEKLKRFDLDTQVNDLLNEMLSKIPKFERTYKVINEIHTHIERFKQLRQEFSNFDSIGNITEKVLKGLYNKPLSEALLKLNNMVPWILPVVINKKKIYDIEVEDNQYVLPIQLSSDLTDLNKVLSQTEKRDEQSTIFKNILKSAKPYYKPFEQYISDISIADKTANTFLQCVSNIEDFNSFAVKNEDMSTIKFQLTPYTTKDTLNIIGFLILPKLFISESRKYLPGVNIQEKSFLNNKKLFLKDYLNKKTRYEQIEITNFTSDYEYDNFYKNIKYISSISDEKNYNKFIDTIIPKIKNFMELIKNNIKENEYIVSYNKMLSQLEPFHIYYDDLTFNNYRVMCDVINDEIQKYKKKNILNDISYEKYKNIRNSEYIKYSLYYSNVINLLDNYNIFNKNISEEEFIKLCLEKDGGMFLQSNIANINFKNFVGIKLDKSSVQEKLIMLNTDETDGCSIYIIAKKYDTISQLENDNNKDIYFDKDKDPTRYDIYEELKDKYDYDDIDDERLFMFLKKFLISNIGLTIENATRDAVSMIDQKRLVVQDDLCVLTDGVKNAYYKRNNNYWVLDRTINESYFKDKTKLLCNSSDICISSNLECRTIENKIQQDSKEYLNKVLTDIEIEQKKTKDEVEELLIKKYNQSLINLKFKITNSYSPNEIKEKLNQEYVMNEGGKSPYSDLLNAILSQSDFLKKQHDILKFENMFTVAGKTKYIRNCKDTDSKLFPTFLSLLARAYINDTYNETIDQICKDQGEISDNGDTWVDKYSGLVIKELDYSTEEGYNESGFKVVSRDILDNGIEIELFMDDKRNFQGDKGIIHNVISTMTNYIGIVFKEQDIDVMLDAIIQIIQLKVPEKSVYDKKRTLALKKGMKVPPYETTYYNVLLLTTLSIILVDIQTLIPTVVPKKSFPGCIKSFSGFPLGDESDISGLKYISCVANKIKSDNTPWDTIKRVKEDTLIKQMVGFIKNISSNAYIETKLSKKNEYLRENPELSITVEKKITWKTFLPELNIDYKETFYPLTEMFFKSFNNDFTSSNHHYLYYILSKMFYLSLKNQDKTNLNLKMFKPSIVTNIGVPHVENSYDLTLFNKISDWYKFDNNDLAGVYMEYYDYVKSNSNANIYFNNGDTKLKYSKIPQGFTEITIYNTFIFYCLKRVSPDEELDAICKTDRRQGVKTIEELKQSGVNYDLNDFVNLLQHIFSKNIIRSSIDIVQPSPEYTNSKLSSFIELYMPLLGLSNQMYTKYREKTDTFRNFMLEYSESVKVELLSFFRNDLSYTVQHIDELTDFLEKITSWNTVNGSLTINTDDLTQNTNNTFLKNSILNLSSIYLNIIVNNVDYSNIEVRKSLKLSERHINTIKTFVHAEFQPLEKFFDNRVLGEILLSMSELNEVSDLLNDNIVLEIIQNRGFEPVLGKDTMSEVYEFILYVALNIYLQKCLEINSLENKKNLGDLLFTMINLIKENKKTLNMTQEEMYSKLLKYKEVEKSEITTYLRDISDEHREIENMQKNLKLGKWSKGQTKGLVTYTADTYDGELLQQDTRDSMNISEVDILSSEQQEQEFVNIEINREVNDLGFIADDDDFGERDGDEGF